MGSSKIRISIDVGDPVGSAAFYEALLGAPPVARSASGAVFEFDSPPVVLTLSTRSLAGRPAGLVAPARHPTTGRRRPPRTGFALLVTDPSHVGDAAIALRRAGVALRIEDRGVQAVDPDGNDWRVCFAPSASGRSVVTTVDDGLAEPRT